MTCIVAIEYKNKVYMAGDTLGSNGWTKNDYVHPKVFKKGDLIVGYPTSFRFGQIIEHFLDNHKLPKGEKNIYKWLCTKVVPDIREKLKEHGYSDGKDGGQALIGIKDQLWFLESDYCVLKPLGKFASVGCGEGYAMGSLYTNLKNKNIDDLKKSEVEEMLKTSIESAAEFSTGVSSNCHIIHT